MTTTLPTIADIVGADREAEARALVEQFASILEDAADPVLAYIIRRRILSGYSFTAIATATGWDVAKVTERFLAWAEAMRVALELTQSDRQST